MANPVPEDEDKVRGVAELNKMAEKGLALFAKDDSAEAEGDPKAAQAFKDKIDAQIKAIDEECEKLTGKENKKARTEKSKEASALKVTAEYIDAGLILKGKPPKNGNFVLKAAVVAKKEEKVEEAAAGGKKDDKKAGAKKGQESAGISKAERDELEKCKNDIIARKTELKAGGMSGGQMNKDEQIVAWVKRMNDLKEKENPGALAAEKEAKKPAKKKGGGGENAAAILELEKEMEEYRQKLVDEFKYTKKEIAADPDMADMVKKLKDFNK